MGLVGLGWIEELSGCVDECVERVCCDGGLLGWVGMVC